MKVNRQGFSKSASFVAHGVYHVAASAAGSVAKNAQTNTLPSTKNSMVGVRPPRLKKPMTPAVTQPMKYASVNPEVLKGGKADGVKSLKTFNRKQVHLGLKEEREHTSSKKVALEITKDHLKEDPRYYSKLKKVMH